MTKKILNYLLLITFLLTIFVPLTGIAIHKLASALFLLLCVVHTVVYRRKLGIRSLGLLAIVLVSFLTGLFGMIFDQLPLILRLHRVVSIASVFFLAIHIFIFHRRLK